MKIKIHCSECNKVIGTKDLEEQEITMIRGVTIVEKTNKYVKVNCDTCGKLNTEVGILIEEKRRPW